MALPVCLNPSIFVLPSRGLGWAVTNRVKDRTLDTPFRGQLEQKEYASWNPCRGSRESLGRLNRLGYRICFLTARTDSQVCVDLEKHRRIIDVTKTWVDKHFPFAETVLYSGSKIEYAQDFLFLLDDRGKTCQQWQQAGGQAVIYNRSWNDRYHSNGIRVFAGWLKDDLLRHARKIESAIQPSRVQGRC